MQTTLLGFAIALIVAMVAALVGPHFVNWNDHRAFFEAKASQLIGLQVNVAGDVDASILPFPSVTLGGIAIGPAGGDNRLRAGSLRIELALGALMRGEVRAVEMRLVKPEFSIGFDRQGQIDLPVVALATETLSIDRLSIENGRATLTDEKSRTELVLDQLWFSGEVRSLTGPFRGKGEFVTGGGAYGYSVSAGRHGPEGIRVRFGLQTAERPLTVEADGLVRFERGGPRFDGILTLARPAGPVLAGGKATAHEPWRLTSKVRSGLEAARLDEILFQYGPDDRATSLAGSGEFKFGAQARLDLEFSARQLDLDRLFATNGEPRRLPLSAVRALGEMVGGALRPPWPLNLSLRIDVATLGGATVHSISGRVRSDGKDWHLDNFEFRAPGFTQVRLRGRLDPVGHGIGFTGDTSVDANDPKTLVGWLAGRAGTAAGQIKPWHAKGVVTLGADRIAVERLQTEFERGAIAGRASYSWPAGDRPARLDAELKAAELDLDAVLGFSESALSGLGLERPREAALAIEIGRARLAGFEARDTTARLTFDADGIVIERLSIVDFGDASIDASGRIQDSAGDKITIDLDARQLGGVVAVAEKYLPLLAEPLRRLAGPRKTAKLHAVISREKKAADVNTGSLDLTGRVGAIRVNFLASATGKSEHFSVPNLRALGETEIRLGGEFDADDGGVLLAVIGLDRIALAGNSPARLVVNASGPVNRELRFDGKLRAGPIDAEGAGTLRLPEDQPAVLGIERFTGTIGDHPVKGHLALRFGETLHIDGLIDADTLDAPATIAAAVGMPARSGRTGEAAAWGSEPFASGETELTGRIEFKAQRAVLAHALAAERLRGVVRFGRSELVFEDVQGELGNGRLDSRLELTNGPDGLSARVRIALQDADAAALLAGADQPLVSGRLQFRTELTGSGRSPASFIGSLAGNATVTLEGGQLAGLNPGVFDAVVRATELGIAIEGHRIREFVTGALESAKLPIGRVETAIGVNAGQARFSSIAVRGEGADLRAQASVDLAEGTLDALLTLTGQVALSGGVRPEVQIALKGALPALKRSVDSSQLSNWLTLLAVDQQAKQLDAIERSRQGRREPAPRTPMLPERAPRSPETPPQQPHASGSAAPVEEAPPLPPPVTIPAGPRPAASPPNAAIRPPGLVGAQN